MSREKLPRPGAVGTTPATITTVRSTAAAR